MDTKLVQDIRKRMEPKSTEELLEISRENDRTKYSDEAFEAIRQLLIERGQIAQSLPQSFTKKEEIGGESGGFFSFRKMVSTSLIKIIYLLGMIGLSITGIVFIMQSTQNRNGSIVNFWTGLAMVVLGNLIWRIVCEIWIVLFSMHEILGSIEKELKKK